MSNFDLLWTDKQRACAALEGWELALTVNEGKPVSTAYLEIYAIGLQFKNRAEAVKHVIARAQTRSKLHIDALSACTSSRAQAPINPKPRRKK